MQNYPHSNEFQQKRIIQAVRDSLFKYSKMYTLDDIYVFTSLRLLGQYQFDNGYFTQFWAEWLTLFSLLLSKAL